MALYGENTIFNTVDYKTHDEWLQIRKLGIGGSDVAAIIGVSPWTSPSELWLEKTGRIDEKEIDNPTLEFGHLMEPTIKKWFESAYPNVTARRVNKILSNVKRPWAQASLDYECRENGIWGVLEIKTARSQATWSDGVPLYYLTQVQHYLATTERSFAYVAVFFRDTCQFAAYRIERDDAFIDTIESAVDTFWNDNVITDVPPTTTSGTSGEAKALAKIAGLPTTAKFKNKTDPVLTAKIRRYREVIDEISTLEKEKTAIANELMSQIGSDKGIISDDQRVSWVRSERTTLDTARLKAEHPDIYDDYSTTRVVSGGLRVGTVGKI